MRDWTDALGPGTVAIYLFHGVIPQHRHVVRNYTGKHMVLDRFREIMGSLVAHGTPVSMADVVAATRARSALPDRAFAVTFDDGFMNNYSIAAPVLAELGVPTTFYVTGGFVDANGWSWTDMIEWAVERTPDVSLASTTPGFPGVHRTPEEKRKLLDEIRSVVKGDRSVDPYAFATEVCRTLGATTLEPDPDLDQKMTWAEVRTLARHPLFTVGGHGHTHRILAYLDRAELEQEVRVSLDRLRAQVESPIEHYSYPEGLAHCYSDGVIETLRRHGIVCCPTAEDGVNRIGDDLFRLKRIMVVA